MVLQVNEAMFKLWQFITADKYIVVYSVLLVVLNDKIVR